MTDTASPSSVPSAPAARRRTPLSLMTQLGLLMALAVGLSSALAAWLALSHSKRQVLSAIERQVAAIAYSALTTGRLALAGTDRAGVERAVEGLARVPGIQSISILRQDGQPVIAAAWSTGIDDGQRRLVVRHDMPAIAVPDRREPQVFSWWEGSNPASSAWHPFSVDDRVGWINVRADLQAPIAAMHQAWIDVFTSVALVCLACFGGIVMFLRRSLKPLVAIAQFASRMRHSAGELLTLKAGSREVARLSQALNETAIHLRRHYETIERHDAEMSAVINTTADAIIGVDELGCVTLTNQSTASLFGWNLNTAIGRPIGDALPGLDAARLHDWMAEAVYTGGRGTRIARFECKGSRNGDTEFPVEVALSEVGGAGTTRYALFVRDITEKLAAEDSLRLFRRVVDASNHGVVISSMTFPNEPIVYVNKAFEELTGFTLSDSIGRKCNFLQGDETDQPEVEVLRNAIRMRREAKVQLRNYRRDGTMFWNELAIAPVFDQDGGLTHFVGVQTDVTARVLAQEVVTRRGEQLDTILSLSPDGFVMFDAQRIVAYANEAFCAMIGVSADELIGRVSFGRFEAMMQERCDPALIYPEVLIDTGEPDTLHLMQPARRILERVIRTSRSGNGELILCYRDVTRESEIDRMKSEFLSTAAHELRTPMVSIYGFAELMLHRNFSPERTRVMLETIHRQSGLIVNLVNELLDLARIEARSGKDFNIAVQPLKPIVDETLDAILMPNDHRRVEVDWEDHDDVLVAVDAEKLRQALNNLVSNAYKYSPQGGRITLSLISHDAPHGRVGIRVTDEGIGMNPEQLSRVFERFYRADPSGNIPGTGLGLCLVKEIVELQGGSVEIASQAGQGTQVTVWLPRREPARLAA